MYLSPSIRALLFITGLRKPVEQMSLDEIQRVNQKRLSGPLSWLLLEAKPPLANVVNRTVPGRHGDIPVRLYYPAQERPLPLVIFFHGGGWVTGTLDTHDVICRRIAYGARVLLASVDYRLAPWHRFPVPLEDCYDATCWLTDQAQNLGGSEEDVAVMGDSAGGNLATAVCLMARDQQGPSISRQILIYPVLDGTRSCDSYRRYRYGPLLTKASMDFFVDCYARSPDDLSDPYFSPLLADDLSRLPPALIQTAEYDPLHDEATLYGEKLQAAGVEVHYSDYPGMIHAFLSFPRFCAGAQSAFTDIINFMTSVESK